MGCGRGDLVVSSLAIHNIPSNEAHAQAVGEAWRMLKPGAADVARRLGWRFWYGNPFAGTSLVTASKADK